MTRPMIHPAPPHSKDKGSDSGLFPSHPIIPPKRRRRRGRSTLADREGKLKLSYLISRQSMEWRIILSKNIRRRGPQGESGPVSA